MGFGSENESGKQLRQYPDIIKDKHNCLRLETKKTTFFVFNILNFIHTAGGQMVTCH